MKQHGREIDLTRKKNAPVGRSRKLDLSYTIAERRERGPEGGYGGKLDGCVRQAGRQVHVSVCLLGTRLVVGDRLLAAGLVSGLEHTREGKEERSRNGGRQVSARAGRVTADGTNDF